MTVVMWVYLVSFDPRRDPRFIYSELARPLVAEGGRFVGFDRRVLFPPYDVTRPVGQIVPRNEPENSPATRPSSDAAAAEAAAPIEVPVRPKDA